MWRAGSPRSRDARTGTGAESGGEVRVQLNPAIIPNVHADDPVVVTLPNGTSRKGEVSKVGAVVVPQGGQAGQSAQSGAGGTVPAATATVTITVEGSIRDVLDQAQVQVGITSAAHKNVLAVPIVALLARPGGTYEVIVVDGTTRRHVTVQMGLFDEGSACLPSPPP